MICCTLRADVCDLHNHRHCVVSLYAPASEGRCVQAFDLETLPACDMPAFRAKLENLCKTGIGNSGDHAVGALRNDFGTENSCHTVSGTSRAISEAQSSVQLMPNCVDLRSECCNGLMEGLKTYPQPLTGPLSANELEDDRAATLQYGHCPLSSFPYPQLPCNEHRLLFNVYAKRLADLWRQRIIPRYVTVLAALRCPDCWSISPGIRAEGASGFVRVRNAP